MAQLGEHHFGTCLERGAVRRTCIPSPRRKERHDGAIRHSNPEIERQGERRIAVGTVCHAKQNAPVYQRGGLAQQGFAVTWMVAIEKAELRATIVYPAVLRGEIGVSRERIGLESQPGNLSFLYQPAQRYIGQAVIRISAADIRVHTGEP